MSRIFAIFGTIIELKMSVAKSIELTIKSKKSGKFIFVSDFTNEFDYEVVKKSLQRLAQNNFIIRLSGGIYYKPQKDKILGTLKPTLDVVAEAIARRDKSRIIPTGSFALYKLGLSEQVPMNIVYLTDGSPRIVKVGSSKITFKKTSPKDLAVNHKLSSLLIQSLKELGLKNVDDYTKKRIKQIIKQSNEIASVKKNINNAPVWIQTLIKSMIKEIENE